MPKTPRDTLANPLHLQLLRPNDLHEPAVKSRFPREMPPFPPLAAPLHVCACDKDV